jgi:hypothetical protein
MPKSTPQEKEKILNKLQDKIAVAKKTLIFEQCN